MLTNHKPVISGTDEGIWRRIKLVPWDVVIPVAERDEELPDRLALETDAVLAWLVAGYLDWREHGLADPKPVTTATDAYRAESDALSRFLEQECMEHGMVSTSELFAAWVKWCADEGEEPGTQTKFSATVENRGFDKYKDSGGRMRFRGLALGADERRQR
jgi:putative DNA primase/helicase